LELVKQNYKFKKLLFNKYALNTTKLLPFRTRKIKQPETKKPSNDYVLSFLLRRDAWTGFDLLGGGFEEVRRFY
jgi:hypothetical protein